MSAKRGLSVALVLAVVATALVLARGRQTRGVEPARREAKVAASDVERPRRARATRPRPAAPETREASVAAPNTTTPAATTPAATGKLSTAAPGTAPASAQAASPRAQQLATTVLQAAVRADWIVLDEQGTPCQPQKLRIVYDAPSDLGGYQKGAYFEPLGPGPGDTDSEVNGLLLCEGSTFLYRGFEAYYRADRGQWDVFPFPVIE